MVDSGDDGNDGDDGDDGDTSNGGHSREHHDDRGENVGRVTMVVREEHQ